MNDIVIDIDLDEPARPAQPPTAARRSPLSRAAVLLVFALAATAPQATPVASTWARRVPLPSYCTGAPMAGGRLNILDGDDYIILDGTTKTIISQGHCPATN